MIEITFGDFAALMAKRKRTIDDLVDLFRGKIEDPREFFERVISCRWRNPKTARYDSRSEAMIPYRSVIEYYHKEQHFFSGSHPKHRVCACGCGKPVFDRKKWAMPYCRQKNYRKAIEAVSDSAILAVKVADFIDARL